MDINIITWSEGFYEHYMKILKGKTVIYYGEDYNIISCENEDFALELNYGLSKKTEFIYEKKEIRFIQYQIAVQLLNMTILIFLLNLM